MSKALNIISPKVLFITFLLLSFSNVLLSQEDLSTLLLRLDSTIEKSNSYTQVREIRIANYKKKLQQAQPFSIAEYQINSQIYKE